VFADLRKTPVGEKRFARSGSAGRNQLAMSGDSSFPRKCLTAFVRQLAKSELAVRLSRRVVQTYDNDQNFDMWENGEMNLLRRVMAGKAEGVVIDTGANVGDWSLAVAELARQRGNRRLIAVDPLERNLALVKQKLEAIGYSDYRLLQAAISDSAGEARFYSTDVVTSGGTDSLFNMKEIGYEETKREVVVTKMTLADVAVHERVSRIFFLKMDIEGGEYAALRGAEPLLQAGAVDYIQIEFGHAARAARVFLHDIVRFMERLPYKMFVIKPAGISPVTFTPFTENRYSYINFIFVRDALVPELKDIILPE
jgi:FkbM family methyltransferase